MQQRAFGTACTGAAVLLVSACVGSPRTTGATASGATAPGSAALGSAATAGAPSAPTAAAPTAAPIRDAGVDLVIWCDAVHKTVLDAYAAQFARANGITVAVQVSTDVRTDFANAFNAGRAPDVIIGAHDWAGQLVRAGAVQPVVLSAEARGRFMPSAITAAQLDGRLWGVPYAVESIGLVRNTALAPDAPTSYEDMVSRGTALKDAGKATNVVLQEVGRTGSAYYVYPYLKAFGGGIFANQENGDYDPAKLLVNSAGSVKGAEQLAALGRSGVLSTDVDRTTADAIFDAGKAPYYITGPWAVDAAKKAGVGYAISPLPSIGGQQMQPFLEVQLFYVSAGAKNDAFAQEFVTSYGARTEVQVALSRAGHRLPALTEAYTEVSATDPDLKAWFDAGRAALPTPNIPAMSSVWGPLGQASADVIDQKSPARERFDAAQAEIVADIAKG